MSEKIFDQDAEQPTRRHFLRGTIAVSAVLGYGGARGAMYLNDRAKENRAADRVRNIAEGVADQVKTGMAEKWEYVSVWPGLAILPSSVEMYSTPNLHKDTKINWPKEHQGDHLAIQRPFMIKETIQRDNPLEGGDMPSDEVFGFWLPDSDDIAFVDRAQYTHQILLAQHSDNEHIFSEDYQRISGEQAHLEPAVEREGLTWRYLETWRSGEHLLDDPVSDTVQKVCGRSLWAGIGDTRYLYEQFSTRNAVNVIPLPEQS